MDILGTKGVAVCFCKSVEFPQCFNDLELVKLFKTIGYINGQVGKVHPKLPGTQDKALNIYKVAKNVKIRSRLICLVSHPSIGAYR